MRRSSRLLVRSCSILLPLVLLGPAPPRAGDRECVSPTVEVCTQEEIEDIPVATLANLNWRVQTTPSGYSDFIIRGEGAFPQRDPRTGQENLHEYVSGELMMAFEYNDQPPMWATRCPRYPDWKVEGYDYQILEAPSFEQDTDGDGINEGQSRFGNDLVEYTVRYDMDLLDEGVAMGTGSGYRLSDRFALKMTYEIFNPGPEPITDFSAYLLFHGHPANTEIPNADGVYDPTDYTAGSLQAYRYDSTVFAEDVSGLTDGFDSGSAITDFISIQTMQPAAQYGAGPYNGHGAGKPVSGEHCQIESGSLGMETSVLGAEAALSRRWDIGDIPPGETRQLDFLITQSSESKGIDRGPFCLRLNYGFEQTDPELRLTHGACDTPSSTTPSDIVSGSISKLAVVPDCDPAFDCTRLTDLTCVRAGYGLDRLTLEDDGHPLDARYYLAREAGRFTSWGEGQQTSGRPLRRFLFTPSTVPDLDVVDACPTGSGSVNAGPPPEDLRSAQRRFSFDVDAWSREKYQHWIDRATP